MNQLTDQLREASAEMYLSHPEKSVLMDRAANAIEEYQTWLHIIKDRAEEKHELLKLVVEFLRVLAGKV